MTKLRTVPRGYDPIEVKQRTCQECGMLLEDAGEFHPHAFCVWKKAGLDPWATLAWVTVRLGLGTSPRRNVRDLNLGAVDALDSGASK